MAKGKYDINEVLAMMQGVQPTSIGRILVLDSTLIVGLLSKKTELEENHVYQINKVGSSMVLEDLGESHVNFNDSYMDVSTTLLHYDKKLILTDEELRLFEEQQIKIKDKSWKR